MNTKDFSNQNLQGHSFKDANFSGANFSGADIRGTDFTNTNLTGADFRNAKGGLQRRWAVILIVIALLLASLSGFVSSISAVWTGYLLSSTTNDQVAGVIIIISYLFFIKVIVQEGLQAILKALGIAGLVAVILIIAGEIAGNASLPVSVMAGWSGFVIATAASIVTMGLTLAVTTSTTVFVLWGGAVGGSLALGLAAGISMITSVITSVSIEMTAGIGSLSVVLIVGGLSTYVSNSVGRQAIAGNEKHTFAREIAINFAAIRGTSFRRANLTNADFTGATLKSMDFRGAILTNTCWYESKKLDRVRSGMTYLKNAQIRQVLVTREGQDEIFDRQNFRGVNLKGANLADASFIGADLSQANLQDANLSRAKLIQAQLDATDFTGATLTGAYIQDWGITRNTKFDGVRCEYVYLRLPTKDNPDPHRKPDNRQEVFADGEFGDFIKPIFDTLDLYHNQGVDPRAIAISFKQLAENHPDAELEIVAIEKRSENNFLLRAKTVPTANKSQLNAEYFELYNNLKTLPKEDLIFLLAQRDGQIQSLEVAFRTVNQGLITVAETPKKVSNFNLQNAQFAGGLVDADTVTANQIGGNITNYTTDQHQNLAEAAAEIQQLLNQLGQTYPTNTPLEKQIAVTEALKQIDSNPTLKVRVIGALKAGGTEAFKELIDHPLVNILLASIDGWQDAE